MSHSHLVVQHLLKHMESWQPGQLKNHVRPDWLTQLIEDTAEMFEPLTGVARVGFDCRLEEDCWVVRMYLGSVELIGGPNDGQLKPMAFELDIQRLFAQFDQVSEFFWSVFPEATHDVDEAQSYITISGRVQNQELRMHLLAVAPDDIGPGMRLYPDGHFETA